MFLSRLFQTGMACLLASAPFSHADLPNDTGNADTAVIVSDAYVRGLPPGQSVTAAFMQWKNTSTTPRQLMSIESAIAERVELHSHSMADGVMQMRKVDALTLNAGQTLELKPGGYHLMLIGLKQPLRDGEKVLLNICFDAGCVAIDAPVVSVLNEHSHHHH